jgi:hypothetical protein
MAKCLRHCEKDTTAAYRTQSPTVSLGFRYGASKQHLLLKNACEDGVEGTA